MNPLEQIFEENQKKVYEGLKKEFLAKMSRARDVGKVYNGEVKNDLEKEYMKLETEYQPFSINILRNMKDISDRDRFLSDEDILKEALKDIPKKDIQEVIRKISTLQAHIDFSDFHYKWFWKWHGETFPEKQNIETENKISGIKIEWLGTQKELGELFVELQRKQWIKEINISCIKAAFTQSKTIHQTLKPTQQSDTKGATYEEIYSPHYRKKFDNLKHNPKPKLSPKNQ